ncbi:MAG: hypothetical protein QOI88_1698 [Gammaproteobacteria bacterium]|jgi:hypothetical protein|nr:hypothetical protein [Gammaproteobacteria bacterium]
MAIPMVSPRRIAPIFAEDVVDRRVESDGSAVSWTAIVAGAIGAATVAMLLILLGSGLGMAAATWTPDGMTASTAGILTIIWMTVVQFLASTTAGYLAGRLRSRWVSTRAREVYFRDTAHGILSWAIATFLTIAILSTAVSSVLSGIKAAPANAAESNSSTNELVAYYVDSLFRPAPGQPINPSPVSNPDSLETARIVGNAVKIGALPQPDREYLAQMVAVRTNLSQTDAERRVEDTFSEVQESIRKTGAAAAKVADASRKASAYTALWLAFSMLLGGFTAAWAATVGGRLRDSSHSAH